MHDLRAGTRGGSLPVNNVLIPEWSRPCSRCGSVPKFVKTDIEHGRQFDLYQCRCALLIRAHTS